MVEFYAFVDQSKQENKAAVSITNRHYNDHLLSFQNKKQHMFVNIEPTTNFTDPNMEVLTLWMYWLWV